MEKAMEENSAHALDRTLIEASEKTRDWTQFLPIERIKNGAYRNRAWIAGFCGARRLLLLLLNSYHLPSRAVD
jgi:hypothetical protein